MRAAWLTAVFCAGSFPATYDVAVYGGTAGGVIAAVTSARLGARTALLEPGRHLGGMTSSGLGAVMPAGEAAIGGYPLEFFRRVGGRYGEPVSWRFEPHVAESVLREMAADAGVDVFYEHRLWGDGGVRKKGRRILSLATENGVIFEAKVFVDASYEGDLMARAGVSYTVGREAVKKYGEPLAGVRLKESVNRFGFPVFGLDAKKLPLAGILLGPPGETGAEDKKVPAYAFRLCLSRDPDNQAAIPKPAKFDPTAWELPARYLAAFEKHHGRPPRMEDLFVISPLPNSKVELGNRGPVSTDAIGASWAYPEAGYAVRARIWQDHINYTAGLFYFLSADPRVPEALRKEIGGWALCADEFAYTRHWPHQFFIREARRMTGEFVLTQRDLQTHTAKPDPIGTGPGGAASHHVQRYLQLDGTVQNEGSIQLPAKPFQIPYRVLLPKKEEVENLLVPVCVSSSHVAYAALASEPVRMILGQAAGAAAKLAIARSVPVQEVDTAALAEKLREQGAVLELAETESR